MCHCRMQEIENSGNRRAVSAAGPKWWRPGRCWGLGSTLTAQWHVGAPPFPWFSFLFSLFYQYTLCLLEVFSLLFTYYCSAKAWLLLTCGFFLLPSLLHKKSWLVTVRLSIAVYQTIFKATAIFICLFLCGSGLHTRWADRVLVHSLMSIETGAYQVSSSFTRDAWWGWGWLGQPDWSQMYRDLFSPAGWVPHFSPRSLPSHWFFLLISVAGCLDILGGGSMPPRAKAEAVLR